MKLATRIAAGLLHVEFVVLYQLEASVARPHPSDVIAPVLVVCSGVLALGLSIVWHLTWAPEAFAGSGRHRAWLLLLPVTLTCGAAVAWNMLACLASVAL